MSLVKAAKKRQQSERETSHKLLALSRGYSKYYSVLVSGSGNRKSAGSMLILEHFIMILLKDRKNRRTGNSPPVIIKGGYNQYRNEAFAQPQIPSYRT